jgi:hypothetical protein
MQAQQQRQHQQGGQGCHAKGSMESVLVVAMPAAAWQWQSITIAWAEEKQREALKRELANGGATANGKEAVLLAAAHCSPQSRRVDGRDEALGAVSQSEL